MTFTKYIQDIRLTIAQKNICNTDDTIEDIAASVGYNNLGYFYKIFKEKYNMTPAEMKSSAK
jgi:two-component system response regulator YesN